MLNVNIPHSTRALSRAATGIYFQVFSTKHAHEFPVIKWSPLLLFYTEENSPEQLNQAIPLYWSACQTPADVPTIIEH